MEKEVLNLILVEIREMKGDMSEVKTRLTNLEGQMTNLETDMSEVKNDILEIKERLTTVEYKLLEHDKKFDKVFNQLDIEEKIKQKVFVAGS